MGRPGMPLLNRQDIAREALALIDEDGAAALSLRTLANRMGVRPQSIYQHIDSRDDLLDALTELIAAGIDHASHALHAAGAAGAASPWRPALEIGIRRYRDIVARHPEALALIAQRPVRTAAELRANDATLRALVRIGLTPAEAAEVAAAVDYLVTGSALEPYTAGFPRAAERYRPEHPALADALEAAATPEAGGLGGLDDRGFCTGLTLLLDGLAGRLAARARGAAR